MEVEGINLVELFGYFSSVVVAVSFLMKSINNNEIN